MRTDHDNFGRAANLDFDVVAGFTVNFVAVAARLKTCGDKRAVDVISRREQLRITRHVAFTDLAGQRLYVADKLVAQLCFFAGERRRSTRITSPRHPNHCPPGERRAGRDDDEDNEKEAHHSVSRPAIFAVIPSESEGPRKRPNSCGDKSIQRGFLVTTSAFFFARRQPLISFSRAIASRGSS